MSDREEREEHIKRLEAALACEEKQFSGKCAKQACDDNCALLYEQGNWGEWKETLRYAINSLKIDLKYDLLYEETSGQADKNDLGVSSGLEKNSKKLEKDFGESDCISRSDVLKLMQDNWHTHNGDWAMQESMDDIRALPAVTPQEPRKGHWMGDSYGYICSNCEHSLNDLAQSMDYISFSKPKYCPNCGAKMIELQESEG